ncbi:MAG: hypothetical protein EBZ89_16250, partial [Chloroflexi bacterium]|nr:hypothetical protein [Chloroflexota bacterium]
RDVRLRYVGASLGLWWAAVTPLLFVGAYTLLFTFLFRARLTPGSSPAEYALYVVTGLLPWVALQIVLTAGMFFTPIFYRTDDLPALVAQVVGLNPLTPLLGAYRAAFLGTAPDPVGLAVFTGFSLMLLVGGFITFERVRSELSDIL